MRSELLSVLRSISDDEWSAPTACEGWSVKDVTLHLLGDGIGLLSGLRDGEGEYRNFDNFEDLVAFINERNDIWVKATRRMSRRVLLSQLEMFGNEVNQLMVELDPHMPMGSVGWTGNNSDPAWLHVAREYTEYWMHHQHICEAVNRVSLKSAHYISPLLQTFAYAFPQTYRNVDAPVDTVIRITITGEGGGEFFVVRDNDTWHLYAQTDTSPNAVVTLSVDTAWRMFTKGISAQELSDRITIEGDIELGKITLNTIGILA